MESSPIDNSLNNALEKYYKLKEKYEKTVDSVKIHVNLLNPLLSRKKKQEMIAEKIKCINCKESGGTVFLNNNNILLAVCGNSENPCRLHIEIKKGVYRNLREIEELYARNIDALQTKIIKIKLNLLFGYVPEDETLTEFTKYREILGKISKEYEPIQREFIVQVVGNEAHWKMIEEKENHLFELVDELRLMAATDLSKDYIEHYTTKILPLNEEIAALKYKLNDVYIEDKYFILTREPYTNKMLEMSKNDDKGKVIKNEI
jgi:hypothetical protein